MIIHYHHYKDPDKELKKNLMFEQKDITAFQL